MGITFTRKGYIQVLRDGVVLSEHVEERKAVQSLSEREDGDYVLRYPDVAVTVILRKSDTTPPAVPSDFSASAATATSVTLTLTANVESDFSNYVLERSSDNIGWGYLKSFTGTSTTDTVDVSGTTYYYRAFSIDTRGNRSAYTAVKSAGPYTVNLSWNGTVPNVSFTRGNAQNFDLSSYIIGSSPTITVETGTLPAGVTLNSTQQRLEYDGSSATSTSIVATGISLRLSNSVDADWLSRSTASGVFYSHNFTYKNAAKTQLITSDTDLHSSVIAGAINRNKLHWDTANKLSGGGSAKISILASEFNADSGFGIDFAGIGLLQKTTIKHEFYVQFAYYMDAGHHAFWYGDANVYGGKIAIIESANSSFDPGEVVIRRTATQHGFVQGYRYRTSDTRLFFLQTPNVNPYLQDGPLNNFVDLGSPTVSSINTMQQRHGVNYNYGHFSNSPTMDADLANAPRMLANQWYVFEVYVKQVSSGNSIVKIWFAKYGEAPILLMGSLNAGLPLIGALDGAAPVAQIYNGAQFTNYANSPAFWPSSDTYVSYAEIIASDNPINFPGGFTLPYQGTTVPAGYPYNGWTEF